MVRPLAERLRQDGPRCGLSGPHIQRLNRGRSDVPMRGPLSTNLREITKVQVRLCLPGFQSTAKPSTKIMQGPLSQEELLATLRAMNDADLTVISLDDQDSSGKPCPLSEIDPFSFFASFNRGINWEHRRDNWSFLKKRWNLQAPVPDDFDGIPLYQNERSWRFPYAANRPKDHIPLLWKLAAPKQWMAARSKSRLPSLTSAWGLARWVCPVSPLDSSG